MPRLQPENIFCLSFESFRVDSVDECLNSRHPPTRDKFLTANYTIPQGNPKYIIRSALAIYVSGAAQTAALYAVN
jgi:hypothetical protein